MGFIAAAIGRNARARANMNMLRMVWDAGCRGWRCFWRLWAVSGTISGAIECVVRGVSVMLIRVDEWRFCVMSTLRVIGTRDRL